MHLLNLHLFPNNPLFVVVVVVVVVVVILVGDEASKESIQN